jgi:hypothetical protein
MLHEMLSFGLCHAPDMPVKWNHSGPDAYLPGSAVSDGVPIPGRVYRRVYKSGQYDPLILAATLRHLASHVHGLVDAVPFAEPSPDSVSSSSSPALLPAPPCRFLLRLSR